MTALPQVVTKFTPKTTYADNDGYYTACNPTPGTALNTIAALASFAATSPFISIHAGPNKDVYLDYIKLIVGAPGTAGTAIRYAAVIDQGKAAPTGGTQLTPACSTQHGDQSSPAASDVAGVYCGPLVAAAAVSAKTLAHGVLRPVIPVVGDTYMFDFGPDDMYFGTGLVPNGTAIADRFVALPPVVLRKRKSATPPDGSTFQFHIWLPSQSAASSYEVEIGWWEF